MQFDLYWCLHFGLVSKLFSVVCLVNELRFV